MSPPPRSSLRGAAGRNTSRGREGLGLQTDRGQAVKASVCTLGNLGSLRNRKPGRAAGIDRIGVRCQGETRGGQAISRCVH